MNSPNVMLSRISKLLVDRSQISVGEALERRERFAVTLKCGADVGHSRTLQLAVLTAANIASRCFPRATRIVLDESLHKARFLVWPLNQSTFGAAVADVIGQENLEVANSSRISGHVVLFGDTPPVHGALRVTFDGWIAKVGPAGIIDRLAEREYCTLSGVLAGALAISEVFLSFAELNIMAGRRVVGLSLWRPDLPITDPFAVGTQVEFLPSNLWVLGLGHLGNSYLWALASLPYGIADATEVYLNDFDRVEPENLETGMIFNLGDEGTLKTRACCKWLEARGFRTRLIERPFDSNFRCRTVEPQLEPRLALCGFDSNPVRRDLESAGFLHVIESGLGGTKDNFETISFHTLPNPRSVQDLWPDLTTEEKEAQRAYLDRVARENPAYFALGIDPCGRAELAGKSVAVPFVGATAATLVLADAIRLFHDGPAYSDIKISLSDLDRRFARTTRNYAPQDFAGLGTANVSG
jgi:hypothetical protein